MNPPEHFIIPFVFDKIHHTSEYHRSLAFARHCTLNPIYPYIVYPPTRMRAFHGIDSAS